MSLPTIGAQPIPKPQSVTVKNGDGTATILPCVATALFSDGAMQTIANIVSGVVAAELDRRGLTVPEPKDEAHAPGVVG